MTKNVNVLWRMIGVVAAIALTGFAVASCDNATTNVYHTVSFDTGVDGSDVPSAQVRDGQTVARPATNPTRDGYNFVNWYTSAVGGSPFNFATRITANTTVFARWTSESYGYNEPPITVNIADGIAMTMNWIAPGTFTMGQNDLMEQWSWMGAVEHQVTLTRGFYMGIHPVTREQFHAVMGTDPSASTLVEGEVQGRRPVENVNWYHAIAFANRLSIMQGLTPVYTIAGMSNTDADAWLFGNVPTSLDATWNAVTANWNANGFRLATEAEWEYAARAGTTTQWSFGDTDDDSDNYAWTNRNAGGRTHAVGQLKPNAWGLYDMHGNVWEWVWDWFEELDASAASDPTGAVSGGNRVFRGGGWVSPPESARSAIRDLISPDYRRTFIGFRVVRP